MKKIVFYSMLMAFMALPAHAGSALLWFNKGAGWLVQSHHHPKNTVAEKHSDYEGEVVAVHDGDTIRVLDPDGLQHKIRLAYIDAPEIQQAYGTASRDLLRAWLMHERVHVKVADVDQYHREVGQISFGGQDVNAAMLAHGAAWHYVSIARRKQDKADFAWYAIAQARAKQQRLGLWKARNPQAPWAFRRQQRQVQTQQQSNWLDWLWPSE